MFLFLVYRLEILVFCCSEQCVESLRRPYPHLVSVSTSSYHVSLQRLRTTAPRIRAQVPSAFWVSHPHSSLEPSRDKIHPCLVNCVLLLNELVYVADCVHWKCLVRTFNNRGSSRAKLGTVCLETGVKYTRWIVPCNEIWSLLLSGLVPFPTWALSEISALRSLFFPLLLHDDVFALFVFGHLLGSFLISCITLSVI